MINSPRFHVIKDPVHGTLQFSSTENAWVKPFIDSPNFQRLRYIKQLGLGDLIFPGAVHTRFNHCQGCCYVASQIAQKIGLAEEERQLVMVSCLLHDIGHGPFSHAFEGLFHDKLIRHEDWTPYFLAEYRSAQFFAQYNKRNPRHHLTEEKFQTIQAMIMHHPHARGVLADIVSSQLDADRLDYLLRDSHFCGVKYGEFDFRWMLHCMTIVDSGEGERLGITHKGIGVVEHYLMARRLMMRNIYHGQKKLALEAFLVQWLVHLAESLNRDSEFSSVRFTRLGKFLEQVNLFNQKIANSKNVAKLKQEFLQENYATYRELADYDVMAVIKQLAELTHSHPVVEMAKRLHFRQMPKIIRLDFADMNRVEKFVADFKKSQQPFIQDWQISLIQTPHRSYSGEEDPVLVVNERNKVKTLSDISVMIRAISDKSEQTIFLCVDKMILDNTKVQQFIDDLQDM